MAFCNGSGLSKKMMEEWLLIYNKISERRMLNGGLLNLI
jgi:hypothetical protein